MLFPRKKILTVLVATVLCAVIEVNGYLSRELLREHKVFLQYYQDVFSSDRSITRQCSSDFLFYLDHLLNDITPPSWALRMFDSSSKIPKGIITGDKTDLGVFDECINVQGVETRNGSFDGQHCLATATFENEFQIARQSNTSTSKQAAIGMPHLDRIKMALCLPSSCSASDTALIVQKIIMAFENAYGIQFGKAQTEVDPLQCHSKSSPSLKAADWVAISIFIVFILLIALSTIYDIANKSKVSKHELLIAFSAYTNWKRLMSVKSPFDPLPVLNGMRFISVGWVILSQRYMQGITVPSDNSDTFTETMFGGFSSVHITNGTLSGDTFLMINGLVLTYFFLLEINEMKKFNLPLFYFRRYLRMTPPFAMAVLFHSSLLIYMASGPLWDSHAKPIIENCQADWWANLIYIKNYYNPLSECVSQSWYLQVVMQLYWVSPLILYPLWKSPKIGKMLIAGCFLMGLAIDFGVAYAYAIRVSVPERRSNIQLDNDYRTRIYYTTHTRYNSWLIGITVGYMLYKVKKTKAEFLMPKVTLAVTMIIVTFLTIGTVFTIYPFNQSDYVYSPLNAAFFHTFIRTGWSAGVALLVFVCCTGYGGLVNTLLSWKVFAPLTRLTYSMFLTHSAIQMMLIYRATTVTHLDDTRLVTDFISDMILSMAVSVVWFIAFESPFAVLEKALTDRVSRSDLSECQQITKETTFEEEQPEYRTSLSTN